MTAIEEKGEGANLLCSLASMCPCRGLGLAGPAAEMSIFWMQYIAVTAAAEDIRKKSIVMLDQYMLIVKHSKQTYSELEVMHKKA
jgi:hypothetical protein